MNGSERPEAIPVTVTFLEMTQPPAHYPHPPMNRQIALMKTRDMPLHFYRYLMDRVGRKWHWVNVLRLSDEELAAKHPRAGARHPRALSRRRAGRLLRHQAASAATRPRLAYFGMMEHATGQGLGRWFLGAAIEAAWATGPKQIVRADLHARPSGGAAALPEARLLAGRPEARRLVEPLPFEERSQSVMRAARAACVRATGVLNASFSVDSA